MKVGAFVIALITGIATYFVARATLDASQLLAIALGLAVFLVMNGAILFTRKKE